MSLIIKILKKLHGDYLYYHFKRLYEKDPRLAAYGLYDRIYGNHDNFDIDNPKSLIEKITWLELNTDTSLWTLCADKYRMREYVEQCGLREYLPENYGHWENPDDIDFSQLPNEFVLKANNGCGTVKIIRNKNTINEKKLKKELKRWLKRPFGYMGAQSHYLSIKPCILAEELLYQDKDCLPQNNTSFSKSLVDYKFYCCSGVPECVYVSYNRPSADTLDIDISLYDMNWESHPEWLRNIKGHHVRDADIPKPVCFDKMIEICKTIAEPFPEVRVDFYIINDKPIIGELTFTSGYGFFTNDFYDYLGTKVDLSKAIKESNITDVV